LRKLLISDDSPPARESMLARSNGGDKHFNEHLGPLRRFLNSNVGRPWNMVYAEICRHVDRGNVVQKHILTHLFDYVVTNVILIDGKPHNGEPGYWYGDPLRSSVRQHQWYVCPRTGILRRSRHLHRSARKPATLPRRVRLSKTLLCVELNEQWELVTVAPLPPKECGAKYDIIRKLAVDLSSADEARKLYGAAVCATERHPLTKREIRSLPIPVEWRK
jgi:hypothetical protein